MCKFAEFPLVRLVSEIEIFNSGDDIGTETCPGQSTYIVYLTARSKIWIQIVFNLFFHF